MTNLENMGTQPQRSAGRTIARNTIIGVGAQMVGKLITALFQIYVVRKLGGQQFGEYSSVLAWAGLFSVLGDLGVTQYLAREIARDRNQVKELFWDTVSIRFILAIITMVITTIGAILWGYPREIVIATFIFTISYLFQSLLSPFISLLSGNERIDATAILGVITQITFYIFATFFLVMGFDFVWLALAATMSIPVMIVLTWLFIKRNKLGPPRFRINPSIWLTILRMGFPFALIQLSLSFSFRIDTILLSKHVTDIQIGWYNVAYSLIFMISNIVTSFSNAALPTLAREHANNPDSIKPWYYHSTRVLVFVGLPVALAITIMADKIIHFLYQPQIGPAALPLMILIWDLPVIMYHSFCGNLSQSMKSEGKAARVYGSLGIANVILNLILIPPFGIIGAAFATVLTDIFGALQYYFIMRHALGAGLRFSSIAKIIGSVAAMGALLYLLRSWNLFVMIGVGGIAYLIFIWFSGAFSATETQQLVGLIQSRLPYMNKKIKKER